MLEVSTLETNTLTTSFRVLGLQVHAVQISDVIAQMERWIGSREMGRYVAVPKASTRWRKTRIS